MADLSPIIQSVIIGGIFKLISYLWNPPKTNGNGSTRLARINKIVFAKEQATIPYNDVGEVSDSNIAHNKTGNVIVEKQNGSIDTYNNPLARIGY